jgi:hypothetical protein
LSSGFSPVVPSRLVAIEFRSPLIFGEVRSGVAQNYINNLSTEVLPSELSDGSTKYRVLAALFSKPLFHRPLGRVLTNGSVHGLSDVLFSVGGSFTAAASVIIARVKVDGEPSLLLDVVQTVEARLLRSRRVDTRLKSLQNPHRSPSSQGGPRCLGVDAPQAAFIAREAA